jgi:hypothetical protein
VAFPYLEAAAAVGPSNKQVRIMLPSSYQWDAPPVSVSSAELKSTHCRILEAIWCVDGLCQAIEETGIDFEFVQHNIHHTFRVINDDAFTCRGRIMHVFVAGFIDLRGGESMPAPARIGPHTGSCFHNAAAVWALGWLQQIIYGLEFSRDHSQEDENSNFASVLQTAINCRPSLFTDFRRDVLAQGVDVSNLEAQLEMEFAKSLPHTVPDDGAAGGCQQEKKPPEHPHVDTLVTFEQIAKMVDLSPRTLERRRKELSEPYFKTGGPAGYKYQWSKVRLDLMKMYPNIPQPESFP